jgi:hypothetical protein
MREVLRLRPALSEEGLILPEAAFLPIKVPCGF